jgi:hypothetical protein
MEDLFGIIIFAAIFLLSMLGKKKPKSGQATRARAQQRPRPRPPITPRSAPAKPLDAPARPQGLTGFLEMLQGQLEQQLPEHADAGRVVSIEPVHAEDARPLDAASHEAFHEQYVEPLPPVGHGVTVPHRYRLTPRTAREAVVWTAIFSKPKGLE